VPLASSHPPGAADNNSPGFAEVMFRANAGTEAREATLTFTGPNGEVLGTQKVVQPPASSPLQLVALGDSFMAGIGAGRHDSTVLEGATVEFMDNSYPSMKFDNTGRTDKAWARLVEKNPALNVPLMEKELAAKLETFYAEGTQRRLLPIRICNSAFTIGTGCDTLLSAGDLTYILRYIWFGCAKWPDAYTYMPEAFLQWIFRESSIFLKVLTAFTTPSLRRSSPPSERRFA